jgi:glutaconate CoA-transferase, subunit A
VISGLISLEGFGLAPRFRAAAQTGMVTMEEYSEHTLILRLQAAAYGVPYMPTLAGLGTDMIGLHPDTTRELRDDRTGRLFVGCTPLPLDFAIVHAQEADKRGNVRVDPKLVWMDSELVKAAGTTFVTVERIAREATFIAAPHRTTYPRFTVDAVIETPWGAHPTSNFPTYRYDDEFFRAYAQAHSDLAAADAFYADRIAGPETHAEYLAANGGAGTLLRIARRTM